TRLLRPFSKKSLALSVIAACVATEVSAQQAPVEEVMVTGSRIRQTSGMLTPVPVTAVTVTELQAYKPEATISEQLDQLPQFFQTQTAQRGGVISGSSGASFVNMRGIGG